MPLDVKWLKKKHIDVEVESSTARVFKDAEYRKCGAQVLEKFKKATPLLGIKGPSVEDLYKNNQRRTHHHYQKQHR